jgi:hypothetical protein
VLARASFLRGAAVSPVLKKTSSREAAPANAIVGPLTPELTPNLQVGLFDPAVQRLADRVAADVKELAKIPHHPESVSQQVFLKETFHGLLEDSLHDWICGIQAPHSPDVYRFSKAALESKPSPDLHKLRLHAVALNREVQRLRSAGMLGLSRLEGLLTQVIEGIPKKSLVKPKGDKRYPGLDNLVEDLEVWAQLAGGRGFGIPKKKPQKGRIVQLLDKLRRRLQTAPELQHLSSFLPLEGQHPISIYQRAIRDAQSEAESERKAFAAELTERGSQY